MGLRHGEKDSLERWDSERVATELLPDPTAPPGNTSAGGAAVAAQETALAPRP